VSLDVQAWFNAPAHQNALKMALKNSLHSSRETGKK